MAKDLDTNLLNEIAKKKGTEPFNVIEIDWSDDLENSWYSDRLWYESTEPYDPVIKGLEERVLSLGGLDFGVNINGGGDFSEVEIRLDDCDGALKKIIDNHDVHKRIVKIYQTFSTFDNSSDKFLIHRGEISSPIIWNEQEQTLEFTSISSTETREVGFSPEEGQFEFVPEHLIGKPWPLCFGSVIHAPAQKFISRERGRSYTFHNTVRKKTLDRIRAAAQDHANAVIAEFQLRKEIKDEDSFTERKDELFEAIDNIVQTYQDFLNIVGKAKAEQPTKAEEIQEYADLALDAYFFSEPFSDLEAKEDELLDFDLKEIVVEDGENFPQNTPIQIIVKGIKLKGQFNGQVFTIESNLLPRYTDLKIAERQDNSPNALWLKENVTIKNYFGLIKNNDGYMRVVHFDEQDGQRVTFTPMDTSIEILSVTGLPGIDLFDDGGIPIVSIDIDFNRLDEDATILEVSPIILNNWFDRISFRERERLRLNDIEEKQFDLRIGDEIFLAHDLDDEGGEEYVVNIIPSDEIKGVFAFRNADDEGRKFVPVPSKYYEVNLNRQIDIEFDSDGNPTKSLNATTLKFARPLKQFAAEGWEDQLYVSLVSSVGPNTVDVIEHLADNYTDFNLDTGTNSTFEKVRGQVENYPSHFSIKNKRNALDLMKDIAWQARMAIFEIEGKLHLKYLSSEEDSVKTITASDIEKGSFQVDHGTTEELITRLNATWRRDFSPRNEENKIILKNNVNKYGLFEEERDFFIYNIEELVIKSSTFWLIRRSNTWKRVKFNLFLNHLDLEVFDTIKFDLPSNLIGEGTDSDPIKGVIRSIVYDSNEHVLNVEAETNVRAGETTPYKFYWAGSAPSDAEYPTERDNFAGK